MNIRPTTFDFENACYIVTEAISQKKMAARNLNQHEIRYFEGY